MISSDSSVIRPRRFSGEPMSRNSSSHQPMATPAMSHVGGTVGHLWNTHIKPRADARYVRLDVNANLPAGQRETGVFSATANAAGFSAATIGFRPRLPADIAAANAHYMTGGATSANCPGVGQAAAGHLCVYESAVVTSTFSGFFDIDAGGGPGVDRKGTIMFWTVTGSQSRVWGTWTVRAP